MLRLGDFPPQKKCNLIGLISQIHLWDIFHMSCESRLSLRVMLKAGQSDLSPTSGASWSLYSHIHPNMNSHYWELFKMVRCFVWAYLDLIHKRKMAKKICEDFFIFLTFSLRSKRASITFVQLWKHPSKFHFYQWSNQRFSSAKGKLWPHCTAGTAARDCAVIHSLNDKFRS